MNKKIKVVQVGLGPIGTKITQFLLEKKSVQIVGAVDINAALTGKDIGELAGAGEIGIKIRNELSEVLSETDADIAVLTTTSSIEKIKTQVLEIVNKGVNVVSTCEELVYPWRTNPAIANELDEAAKQNNVSILSTGVNPGFLMDFLPAALTAVCRNVNKITVERIQDAQYRRIPFQKKIGAGLTVDEFQNKIKEGTLRHVGLTESIHLIADKLGWRLDKTEDLIEPIVASEKVSTSDITIEKGNALGVQQLGKGWINGEEKISLVFRASVGEANPGDRIIIDGTPGINMIINDGVNGDIATCAITINAIPAVVNSKPGLRTMSDIEPVGCIL